MAEARRGLSIGYYALIMVGLVVLAFLSYGAFTYTEFQRVRADMDATSRAAAEDEVKVVMGHLLQEAEAQADAFADWEEVGQQLQTPRYYTYWRSRRMLRSGMLPDYVVDAEIYDRDGSALAVLDDTLLPGQMGTQFGIRYVLNGDEEGKDVDILVKVVHTAEINKRELSHVNKWVTKKKIGGTGFDGWKFESESDLNRGNWTIQVYHEGMMLAEKSFFVH